MPSMSLIKFINAFHQGDLFTALSSSAASSSSVIDTGGSFTSGSPRSKCKIAGGTSCFWHVQTRLSLLNFRRPCFCLLMIVPRR